MEEGRKGKGIKGEGREKKGKRVREQRKRTEGGRGKGREGMSDPPTYLAMLAALRQHCVYTQYDVMVSSQSIAANK